MLIVSLTSSFGLYILTILSLLAILYIWLVYIPYAKFPACRLEHRLLYWMFKRIPLKYAILQTVLEQSRKYESDGVFAAWLGVPAFFVYGEDIVKKIVCENAANVKPRCYQLMDFAIGKSLLISHGEVWKKQLKVTAPAFHTSALNSYSAIMNKYSKELVERLSGLNGQPTEGLVDLLATFTLKIALELHLGEKDLSTEDSIHIRKVLYKTTDFMVERQFSPWLYFDISLKLFPSAREVHRSVTKLLQESLKPSLEKIKESLLSRQESSHTSESYHELNQDRRFKPFGEAYVEQHLKDPTITMDEITHRVASIVSESFDAVSHALEFAIHLLGLHQDVQDRAFEEVMAETEGHVTREDTQRLTYLECVIKETLRLYPISTIIGRSLTKDLQCGKYKLPRNSTVGVFSYTLHRNPEIYPDPEKFDPERFMDENSRIRQWNFVPFAEGFRPCLGKNIAMMEMKIFLVHVLRNFRIVSLDRIEESDLTWSLILQCTKKLRMQFLPRTP